ncbi:MAG: hypothetical protein JXA24_00625 [Proteobacteria bacterium]|nr:hypothetical protein [Pseudomonadota bacterium]
MTAKAGDVRGVVLRVLALTAALAAAAVAAAILFSTQRTALSLGAGAVIGALSFVALAASISCSAGSRRMGVRAALITGLCMLKLAAIGALLWWLVSRAVVDPLSFLMGFTAVVAALIIEGLRAAFANKGAGT